MHDGIFWSSRSSVGFVHDTPDHVSMICIHLAFLHSSPQNPSNKITTVLTALLFMGACGLHPHPSYPDLVCTRANAVPRSSSSTRTGFATRMDCVVFFISLALRMLHPGGVSHYILSIC